MLGEFGLSHLGARLYDPVIVRFLSRDPLVAPRGGAATSPYAFAMNDPVNLADPTGLDPWSEVEPLTPITALGGGSGSGEGGCTGCGTPAPGVHGVRPGAGGAVPAIGWTVQARVLALQALVRYGGMQPSQASRLFRDFIKDQIYSSQTSSPTHGSWCAAATRQMVLKHAGVIQPGQSYGSIKTALEAETTDKAPSPGAFEKYHFNWTDKGKFVTRLGPEAIARVARNPVVGTGDPGTFHWTRMTARRPTGCSEKGRCLRWARPATG